MLRLRRTCAPRRAVLLLPLLPAGVASAQDGLATATDSPRSGDARRELTEEELDALRAQDVLDALGTNVYGFVQLDTIANTGRTDPDWADVVRPSTLPTDNDPTAFGAGGQFDMSIRFSRFGVKGRYDVGGEDLKTWFEFDLLETGARAGETGLHVRHAWGEWGHIGAGQTHSVFMDSALLPRSHQSWGPPGMVFDRSPQLRYTERFEDGRFALSLEQQGGGIEDEIAGEVSPDFGMDVRPKSAVPDLAAQYHREFDRGHWQIAGVARHLKYETRNAPGNDPSGSEFGWGVNLSTAFRTEDRNALKLGFVAGQGIATFLGDSGTNLAPQDGDGDAVPVVGVTACYEHYWNETWSSSFGYSVSDVSSRNQQADGSFSRGTVASANLMHVPSEHISYSIEGFFVERRDKDGDRGENYRIQIAIRWDFSLGALAPSFDT